VDNKENIEKVYRLALANFVKERANGELGHRDIREMLMGNGISIKEMVAWHKGYLTDEYPDMDRGLLNSLDFLMEMLKGFEVDYFETQMLRQWYAELQAEMEIAASVQNVLLDMKVPTISGFEIGAISIPAHHVNGDYYHFYKEKDGYFRVMIADVIGKGIPAALCMTLIKYGVENIEEHYVSPHTVMERLNDFIEKHVDCSMFISMLYGSYNPKTHMFSFVSAGHEPGLFYSHQQGCFSEMYAKGLLLGVDQNTVYKEYTKRVEVGDWIVLLSDGVTECKTENGFVERDYVVNLIQSNLHLHPQQMVEEVYRHLEELQHFHLHDDFTLIALKRVK